MSSLSVGFLLGYCHLYSIYLQYLQSCFMFLQDNCGLNAYETSARVFTWVVAVAADTVSGRAKPPGDHSRGKRFPIQYVLL